MAKSPLFSTYRAGENRVTASMLAVFERIDIGIVERLLSAATGESSLPFVTFANQIAAQEGSVPDAAISANFRYLFEVKTAANTLRRCQLQQHLEHLEGRFAREHLFVLTPDAGEPALIGEINDERVIWLNFHALYQAIDELLHDEGELLGEQARFLLHELAALFRQEGLISPEDTVVVAALRAYPEYRRTAAYVCQSGRPFREGVGFMGFYCKGTIQREIAHIRHRRDGVPFETGVARTLFASGNVFDREIGALIPALLKTSDRVEGESYQVFLLTGPDDPDTLRLPSAISNTKTDRNGKPWAWTMSQAYTLRSALASGPMTTTELEAFRG